MKYAKLIEKAVNELEENDDLLCDMVDELDSYMGYADGFRAYDMWELDDLHCGMKLSDFLSRVTKDFDLRDNYFYYSIYGLESTDNKAVLYRDNTDCGEVLDNILEYRNHIYINDKDFEDLLDEIEKAKEEETA